MAITIPVGEDFALSTEVGLRIFGALSRTFPGPSLVLASRHAFDQPYHAVRCNSASRVNTRSLMERESARNRPSNLSNDT